MIRLSTYLPNAKPWIEKALNDNWEALSQIVPREMMPSQERLLKSGRMTFAKEYGCGAYGCVLPTGKSDVVFKMTTDETEAQFVSALLKMRQLPHGVVRYHAVVELPGKRMVAGRKEKIFAIWREEARDIGFLTKSPSDLSAEGVSPETLRKAFQSFKEQLGEFLDSANEVLDYYVAGNMSRASVQFLEASLPDIKRLMQDDVESLRGSKRAAYFVGICEALADEMRRGFISSTVGDALGKFIDYGFVLADVHYNNVGIVDRGDEAVVVITDPGHAVPLNKNLWKHPVPQLLDLDAATTRRLKSAAN